MLVNFDRFKQQVSDGEVSEEIRVKGTKEIQMSVWRKDDGGRE